MADEPQDQPQTNETNASQEPPVPTGRETAGVPSTDDVEKNKVFAILAYFGILFIVPLLAAKDSEFAMYHANQGLLLFLTGVAVQVVGVITTPILIGFLVLFGGWIFVFVLFIMGIVNAAKGEMKPLPVVGNIKLLK